MLTPYTLYIKLAIAALLIVAGIWFRGVLSDRDKFKHERDEAKATISDIVKARENEIKLQEGISNAIKNLRVVSNNYIQSIETSPAPAGPDGSLIVLVPGGLPRTMPSLPYGNHSSGGTTPTTEAR